MLIALGGVLWFVAGWILLMMVTAGDRKNPPDAAGEPPEQKEGKRRAGRNETDHTDEHHDRDEYDIGDDRRHW